MRTETIGWTIFAFYAIGYLAVCIVLPFNRVLRSGQFWRGVLLAWLAVAVYTFAGVMIGEYIRHNADKNLLHFVPEGPHFLAAAVLGWWNGMIVCTPAWLIHRRRMKKEKAQNQEVNGISHSAPSAP
jgi:drug/metabolite transporter (DMT)-like permease